jgi:protein gp37
MDIEWARSVRDQCVAAGIPYFYKQHYEAGKLFKMPELDGKVWDQMPEAK